MVVKSRIHAVNKVEIELQQNNLYRIWIPSVKYLKSRASEHLKLRLGDVHMRQWLLSSLVKTIVNRYMTEVTPGNSVIWRASWYKSNVL